MTNWFLVALTSFWAVLPISADTVILNDGSSYTGQYTGASNGEVTFIDGQGVQYQFPLAELQSLVWTPATDIVTLRTGKVYSGHYTGADPISFQDPNGTQYQFPLKDVASLVLTRRKGVSPQGLAVDNAKVIPEGTSISVRADETIDSGGSTLGQLYAAMVSQDVLDSTGAVAIPNDVSVEKLFQLPRQRWSVDGSSCARKATQVQVVHGYSVILVSAGFQKTYDRTLGIITSQRID